MKLATTITFPGTVLLSGEALACPNRETAPSFGSFEGRSGLPGTLIFTER